MKRIRVAVTGMNAVDSPAPGVPVVRSLLESNIPMNIVGFSYGALDPGNFMNHLIENAYLFPYPNAGSETLLERIKVVHNKTPLDIIIPTLDSELDNYISIQSDLENLGIRTFLPTRKELHLRDKSLLNQTLANSEIKLPQSINVTDANSLKSAVDKIGFPLLIKGIFYEAYLAYSMEEAIGYFFHLTAKWGIPIIVQKFISGEEINVCALAKEGELVGAVIMKKLFLTDKGKAWAGVTIQNEEAIQTSKGILKNIHWNGGCELEYIVESKTRDLYLLEINPRFPAWVYLATASGQNLPEALVKICMKEKFEPFQNYEVGKVFVRHSWDDIVPMKAIESLTVNGDLSGATSHE